MKGGVPPTARNARTGEFTPPGMIAWARWKRTSDCLAIGGVYRLVARALPRASRRMTSFKPGQISSTAHTFTSTKPRGRVSQFILSVAQDLWCGHDDLTHGRYCTKDPSLRSG